MRSALSGVSRGTRFAFFLGLAAVCGSGALLPAWLAHAGPAMDAYDRESKAHNDYYRGLSALGPHPTSEQKLKLYSETILPARVATANVYNQAAADGEKSVRAKVYEELKKRLLEGVPKWVLDPWGSHSGKGTTTSVAKTPESAPNSGKPEVVLDGSGIQREIEFAPRSKPSGTPKGAPLKR